MIKAALKRHSTLFALVALMLAFELLGRLLAPDVLDAFTSWQSGAGSWGDLAAAAWDNLTTTSPAFLTSRNLTNLTLQVAINGCLAIGMTLVILTGGIDLSVGSVVALTGIVLGLADRALNGNLALALPATVAAGVAIGGVNGLLIARFAIPPFVITLGMLVIARGAALIVSHSSAISPLSDGIRFLGSGFLPGAVALGIWLVGLAMLVGKAVSAKQRILSLPLALYVLLGAAAVAVFSVDRGLPVPVLVMGTLAALGVTLAGHTVFGRSLYAIGGNEPAAVLAGLDVKKAKWLVYTLMGALAAVAGIVLAGRLNSATPTEGQLMELDAIASAVIGGTSLRGGVGRVQGAILGAFIIGVMNNGMDMLEIPSTWQMVTKGAIIIAAVYSDGRLGRAAR